MVQHGPGDFEAHAEALQPCRLEKRLNILAFLARKLYNVKQKMLEKSNGY
jgi:hypothetical protein